jgi:hypothetical protein
VSLSLGPHWGTWGRFRLLGILVVEGGLQKGSISLRELCLGNLEGGSFAGDSEEMGRRAQGTGISLCGGLAGEPGRGLVYWGHMC